MKKTMKTVHFRSAHDVFLKIIPRNVKKVLAQSTNFVIFAN